MKGPSSITMQNLVSTLGKKLIGVGHQLAVAESCTGGELLALLSAPSGASQWLWGGWVVYSNEAKRLLGVEESILVQFGAVSGETVESLCLCACQKSSAEASIAITGIAGPEGGTENRKGKTVGSVWIGASYLGNNTKKLWLFDGNRAQVRHQACKAALQALLQLMDMETKK